MKNRTNKIYFVHQGLLSFVRRDLEILRCYYETREINNYTGAFLKIPRNISDVIWCDIIFCWFGSVRFLFPILLGRILGKKVVIVAGGYDVVRLPEIGYGSLCGRLRSQLQKGLFKLANHVICVSKSNMQEAMNNAAIPENKIRMIYHGFDVPLGDCQNKERVVITVGKVSEENLRRKGIGMFIEAARCFPNIPFLVIGAIDSMVKEKIERDIPGNVRLRGYVTGNELEDYFKRAKVYVQASMHEGFGCAVAEAMLNKCVPVVSDCFALPEVVGEAGFVFKPDDLGNLKEKLDQALRSDPGRGDFAKRYIEERFPLGKRKKALLDLIDSL